MDPAYIGIVLLIGQWILCGACAQQDLEDPAWKRGLMFGALAAGFAGLCCLGSWIRVLALESEVKGLLLAVLFLADLLVCALMERWSSSRPIFWLLKTGTMLGRLLGRLIAWVPLPLVKAPEKEIIIVKDEKNQEVLENAIELNDKSIDEICTHRSDVISLSLKDSPAKWRQTIMENRHTLYPITNENEDDIVGVLDTRDYFRLSSYSTESIMKNTVDKPWFVAENMLGDELIRQMKQRKTYFAIVLDEYGGMTGIITLHDILEEILGEMADPLDAKRPASIVRLPKNTWRIAGNANLDDVSKALDEKLELDDFETFSGFILGTIGYIPEDDTQLEVTIGDLDIQVKSIKNHRIAQTLVRKIQPAPAPEPLEKHHELAEIKEKLHRGHNN